MEAYFAFTDECGSYQKIRTEKFNKAHPFYVRSTVIISLSDYLALQKGMDDIKISFGLQPNVEIKWAHFGSALKGNYRKLPHSLTPEHLNYIKNEQSEYIQKISIFVHFYYIILRFII